MNKKKVTLIEEYFIAREFCGNNKIEITKITKEFNKQSLISKED